MSTVPAVNVEVASALSLKVAYVEAQTAEDSVPSASTTLILRERFMADPRSPDCGEAIGRRSRPSTTRPGGCGWSLPARQNRHVDDIELWHNPRCSKSRAAHELLGDRATTRRYLEDPPSRAELEAVLVKL